MATNDSKDIELRVRARDMSQKTLDGVTKALDELAKAQVEQVKAAKDGSVSARELEASYKKIENAVEALIKQNNLISIFKGQAQALEDTKVAADKARDAQVAYAASLDGIEKKTAQQVLTQRKLATAVKGADDAQLRAQNRLDKTVARLAEYGIAVDQIAVAQQRMAQGVALGNAALERQSAAIDSVDADIRRSTEIKAAAAAASVKAAADEAAAQKKIADAVDLAATRREKMLTLVNSVAKANYDAVQAEEALNLAMRKSADQAEASRKGYATLARAVKSIKGNELADQIRAISDPIGAANSNLQTLGDRIDLLASKVKAINGPVKDYRATLAALDATMKGAAGIAAQIDAYKRQSAVLKQATADYANAGIAITALNAKLRAGGGDAAELGRQMSAAQATFKTAAANVGEQTTKLNGLHAALKTAGVDTNDLAGAQNKLIAQTGKAATAVKELGDAHAKHGAAADVSTKSQFKFFQGGRTTLDYAQRLKGELLALATAYIGLNAAVNLAKSSLDSYNQLAKTQSALQAANGGDVRLAAQDYDYLRAAADRIGVSFKDTALGYAKLAIASKAFGMTTEQTRFIFEKFAIASTKAGLSGAEFEGVLKALEQMMSKGTIQAEELRGQLGDRLPGAMVFMAAGLKMTTEELGKNMEASKITANAVMDLARAYDEGFKGGDDATRELIMAQARYGNAVTDFLKQIADSGFAQAMTDVLNKLSEFMKSAEGAQLAATLGQAFTEIAKAVIYLIDNLETVKLVLSALTGLLVAKWAYAAAAGVVALFTAVGKLAVLTGSLVTALGTGAATLGTLGTAAVGTAGGVGILRGALLLLTRTVPLLAALSAAIMVAKFAYDKLKASKDAALAPGSTTKLTGSGAEGSWDTAPGAQPDPGGGFDPSKAAAKAQLAELEKNQKALSKAERAARAKSVKDHADIRAADIKEQYDERRKAATTEIKDAKQLSEVLQTIDKQEKQALLIDQTKFNNEHAKSGAAAANKEISLKEQVKNELLRIRDDLAKQETKLDQNATFDERKKTRLDAITHSYDKLKKTITKLAALDKGAAADADAKLDSYIGQLQAVESQKVTLDEVKLLEKELDDQIKLRTAELTEQKTLYDAGLRTQEEFLANTNEINQRGDTAVTKAANNLQAFVDAAVKAKDGILSLTDQAEVRTKVATAKAGSTGADRKAIELANKADEEALNNMVAKRTAAEALLRSQLDLRMIGEDEYAKKTNANADMYKGKILEVVDAMLVRLEAQRAEGLLNGTITEQQLGVLDAQIAKIKLLRQETANAALTADSFQLAMNKFVSSGIDAALNSTVDALTQIAAGQVSVSEGFKNMGVSLLQFVAQFLMEIGKAIAKQLILNALMNSGNPVLMAAGAAAGGVARKHSGGKIGHGVSGTTRKNVDMSIFQNAPRFHEGGLPGLKSDEVPAILQTGEQVLARNDPNNVLNGGREMNVKGGDTRFVLLDDERRVPDAMQSAEGEKAQLVFLKKNAATIKQLAK